MPTPVLAKSECAPRTRPRPGSPMTTRSPASGWRAKMLASEVAVQDADRLHARGPERRGGGNATHHPRRRRRSPSSPRRGLRPRVPSRCTGSLGILPAVDVRHHVARLRAAQDGRLVERLPSVIIAQAAQGNLLEHALQVIGTSRAVVHATVRLEHGSGRARVSTGHGSGNGRRREGRDVRRRHDVRVVIGGDERRRMGDRRA